MLIDKGGSAMIWRGNSQLCRPARTSQPPAPTSGNWWGLSFRPPPQRVGARSNRPPLGRPTRASRPVPQAGAGRGNPPVGASGRESGGSHPDGGAGDLAGGTPGRGSVPPGRRARSCRIPLRIQPGSKVGGCNILPTSNFPGREIRPIFVSSADPVSDRPHRDTEEVRRLAEGEKNSPAGGAFDFVFYVHLCVSFCVRRAQSVPAGGAGINRNSLIPLGLF